MANLIFGNKYVRFASLDSQFNINLLRFASIFKFFKINMFASLRYPRKHQYRRFRFASITMSFAFDDSERVYTKEACAVPES